MSIQTWEHFFKPETRASGRTFVTKGKVSISRPSDTEIQSYVRAATSFKINFKLKSIDSDSFSVECTCPQFKKGQLCKHIWAALLVAQEKHSDFFEDKNELHRATSVTVESPAKAKLSKAQTEAKAAILKKQSDYRKLNYQKQKQRLLKQKIAKRDSETETTQYPPSVESALKYFLSNGFDLRDSMTKEAVSLAKKKLARIFHPDVGGSHAEILELNRFAEILTKFSVS